MLSLDMRVLDPAWIGMKLRKLLNYAEPLGHFMAFVPGLPHGQRRQQTVAVDGGLPRAPDHPPLRDARRARRERLSAAARWASCEAPERGQRRRRAAPMAGARCPECGNATLIHKDGCDFCTACGHIGSCG